MLQKRLDKDNEIGLLMQQRLGKDYKNRLLIELDNRSKHPVTISQHQSNIDQPIAIEWEANNGHTERLGPGASIKQQVGNDLSETLTRQVNVSHQKGLVKHGPNSQHLTKNPVQLSNSTVKPTPTQTPAINDDVQLLVTSLDGTAPGWPAAPSKIDVTAIFAPDIQLTKVNSL